MRLLDVGPATVLALNLRGFTRPLRMMLENPDNRPETYRGMPVLSAEGGDLDIAMVDGTLVLSDDPRALRAAIDRLLDGTGGPVESRLEILRPPPEGGILSGGSSFRPGELSAMLRPEEARDGEAVKAPPIDPARLHGVECLELVVDGLDPWAIRFRLGVAGATPDQARQAAAALDELLRDELATVTYGSTVRTTGGVSVIDARITGCRARPPRWTSDRPRDWTASRSCLTLGATAPGAGHGPHPLRASDTRKEVTP